MTQIDVQNILGETALHWGMRAGKIGLSAVRVLLENGARSSLLNWKFRRPLDVAAEYFVEVDVEMGIRKKGLIKMGDEEEKISARANLLSFSTQSRTLVLHHTECLDHKPKSDSDWEAPDRINSIMDKICGDTFKDYEIVISSDFDRAPLELLSRVHSAEYLTFVNDLSKELERRRKQQLVEKSQVELSNSPEPKNNHTVVPFTPMVSIIFKLRTFSVRYIMFLNYVINNKCPFIFLSGTKNHDERNCSKKRSTLRYIFQRRISSRCS